MKIQAKDLKIGMLIVDGVWSMKVESIKKGFLKNGKPTTTVEGRQNRVAPKNKKAPTYKNLQGERVYKDLTFVIVQ